MERNEAKKLVVKAGLELMHSGLIARTWGNVSCRINEETFVITPSGREYNTLTADDIVEVKIKDLSYEGSITPSSEKGAHAVIYRLCPGAGFVIHTHQEDASAVSATGLDYFSPSSHFPALGKTVVCAKYALPGTKALIRNASDALKISSSHAVILKNHGTLCYGENYEETFQAARQLEAASGAFLNEMDNQIQAGLPREIRPVPDELRMLTAAWEADRRKGLLIFNTDPDVVRFSKLGIVMKPLLDDFAQIVGTKMKTVENDAAAIFAALKSASAVMVKDLGAVCRATNETDAEAVSMIVRKNCKAYFASSAFGSPNYIKQWECILMHMVYLKKYSGMAEKNKIIK